MTGSTGTSISISFIEVYGNATPAAAATGPAYRHFDNTPRLILDRQNYHPFGCGNIWFFRRLLTFLSISGVRGTNKYIVPAKFKSAFKLSDDSNDRIISR
ncbi:MAG: hypothetical protein WA364_16905 [Candidatus Nitrosopolaris sp.]